MNTDLFNLNGKRVLITGGAGDLGWAMVKGLAAFGASVVSIDLNQNRTSDILGLRKSGYDVYEITSDISRRENINNAYLDAKKLLKGEIEVLINSAGMQKRRVSENFSDEDWDQVIAINLTATFSFCKLAANDMLKIGKGKIINIASMQSFIGGLTIPAYAASKGGVSQLTKTLSNDWAGRGINVNAIAPGYMDTQLNTNLINDPKRNAEVMTRIPAGRWGVPDDLLGAAIFLASSASDYVSGAIVPVDGGFLGR